MLTIVMYHYVREITDSRFRNINGLEIDDFKNQLEYLKKYYTFINIEQLNAYYHESYDLPLNSVLLTFDDGYSDHFKNVFPILDEFGVQGAFYVPVKSIVENELLDVNKIHFLLASVDIGELLNSLRDKLYHYRNCDGIADFETYYSELAIPKRFDSAEVAFFKRIFQHKLPLNIRDELLSNMFNEHMGISEKSFSKELYLNKDQCKCMLKHGMHLGAHTYNHFWLNKLTYDEQETEFLKSIDFIDGLNSNQKVNTFTYPYGQFNDDTLNLMKKYSFNLGFTTKVDVIRGKDSYSCLEIPRLDTNDIPTDPNAKG